MITPQYITLTVTRVATKSRNNPKHAQAAFINPPVKQLFILPMMISKAQHGDTAEIEITDQLLSIAEHFDDIVNAINNARHVGDAVARPMDRTALQVAAKQSPLHKIAEEMRAGVAEFVSPSDDEKRAAEGAKHQGEPAAPSYICPDCGAGAHNEHHDECKNYGDGPYWSDFVQADGENVGAPAARRYPELGDLRIFESDLHPGEFVVEVCRHSADCVEGEKPIWEWTRADVPAELRSFYKTRDAAQAAVKLAGYGRRLWEE